MLVNAGADVNTRNFQGNTPLHYAIGFLHKGIVDLLIENGANEQIRNNKRLTAWEGI